MGNNYVFSAWSTGSSAWTNEQIMMIIMKVMAYGSPVDDDLNNKMLAFGTSNVFRSASYNL